MLENVKADGKDLRLFFYAGRSKLPLVDNMGYVLNLAYDAGSSAKMLSSDRSVPRDLAYDLVMSVPYGDVEGLSRLFLKGSPKDAPPEPETAGRKMRKKEFLASLRLTADSLVKDEKDRKTLNKIINKL